MSLKILLNKKNSLSSCNTPPVRTFKPALTELFEDILSSGSSLRIRVTGESMTPFLSSGDIVTIKKLPNDSFRKGDLIFFRNRQGIPVLHRIIKRDENADTIRTKGDALTYFDRPVRDEDVMGKVCMIEKKNSLAGIKCLNMESKLWKSVNYFIAFLCLIKPKFYYASSMLIKRSVPVINEENL